MARTTSTTSVTLTVEQALALAPLFAAVGIVLDGTLPAEQTAPAGKVYRSAKGKAQAKLDVDKAWTDAKAAAKVKRVKDLSPTQRAAVDAKVKAIWASVPKTRTTKA